MSYKDVKQCCEECFVDEYIADFIRDNCEIGSCDYCGKNNVYVIRVDELGEYIRESIEKGYEPIFCGTGAIYDSDEDEYVDGNWHSTQGMSIKDILVDMECIFKEEVLETTLLDDLFNESAPSIREIQQGAEDEYSDIYTDQFVVKNELYKIDDCELHKLWIGFCSETKDGVLGTHDAFLEDFSLGIDRYVSEIKPGEMLYRARSGKIGNDPFEEEMGPAPKNLTKDGRMNKAGTTYLYLASDIDSCKKECRITGEYTGAIFESLIPLKIIDLSEEQHISNSIFDPYYVHENRWLNYFFRRFKEEISRPVNEDRAAYYPTQYIADYFKRSGYCGIAYKSSVSNGISYVFFCGHNDKNKSSENTKVSEWFSIKPIEVK